MQNLFANVEENRSKFQQLIEERKRYTEQIEFCTEQQLSQQITTLKNKSVNLQVKEMNA